MSLTPETIFSHIVGVVSGLTLGIFIFRTAIHELGFHVKNHCEEIDSLTQRVNDYAERIRRLENEDSYRRGREGR